MALDYYEQDIMRCNRCSYCKNVPYDAMKDARFPGICPSIEKYNFHSCSASGRMITALSLLKGRVELDDTVRDLIYQCQMCGGCDVSCKVERDLEPLEILQELRFFCVEKGMVSRAHLNCMKNLKNESNFLGKPKAERDKWAQGLGAKILSREKGEVLFHAGCRYSYDPQLRDTVRSGLQILMEAGVDVGIMGKAEVCCGGRAYEIGFKDEMESLAKRTIKMWRNAGVKTVVTPCASCFQAFRVLYKKSGMETGIKILHITELLLDLIRQGKIKLSREVPLRVAYHDPCHLGRLAEPWIPWQGEVKKVYGQMVVHDPPKPKRFGVNGIFDAPRQVLEAIPGLELREMHRIREYAWCCGSGSGVKEAYPDFSESTAASRIEEAQSVDAQAIVSACPGCKRSFQDNGGMDVYDVVDLVRQAMI